MSVTENLPDGLWPVMLTPFTKNNEVDLEGLERLTEMYLQAGSNGLFANCLSSEMYQMTDEERLLVTSSVVKIAQARVPVVATGTFSRSVSENIDFIKKIYDTGIHAVILITSMLVEPDESEDQLKGRLEEILEQTGQIPLGVYECPVPYKRLLSPSLMGWMASTGRFVYHKDTSCHSGAIDRKAKAIKGTRFNLYNADTTTALDSLESGGSGISPISANYYPEPYRYLLDQYQLYGRNEEVIRLHAILSMMDRVTHSFYPYAAKVFLQQRGLKIETNSRVPTETMAQVDKLRLQGLRDSFKTLADLHGFPLVL
ncbi:dihydrodipicolinate synthase family protein [Telluribacter sp.]|jgi:4-hydroxy-tetrahydrodipicolinate synthase|uniref:dihydrodipicolinate synthase family protein n=1 Tax=Telluribacter sp. TaxID=1978767 RepID=UPI002E0E7244|nr:dihydrodipicolinate synthase family protein [Telluribacter sp.]